MVVCQGLMDIALLSANANQLRHALELCAPYRTLLIVLFSLSILLQVVAGALLAIERFTCKKRDYVMCHRYQSSKNLNKAKCLLDAAETPLLLLHCHKCFIGLPQLSRIF